MANKDEYIKYKQKNSIMNTINYGTYTVIMIMIFVTLN